ncbi:hypothetical protein [Hyphomicrobium sp.]|jgi:hypothetical protein|uniref:hypothetical protein n=1 Tax=Hyphomicrobium sp. TaxID=82 RepID=UPI002BF0A74F|nr:hypothetical protein [Hyphomicrobium sp.]HVZ03973.1 hypothetical protein [Hyphomicrobium sp.]
MKQKYLTFGALIIGLALIGTTTSRADDGVTHTKSGRFITACSRYGNQPCYTAQLQRGVRGKQLILHHGTRIDCNRDCENTLRETTVDFWDTMRENGS